MPAADPNIYSNDELGFTGPKFRPRTGNGNGFYHPHGPLFGRKTARFVDSGKKTPRTGMGPGAKGPGNGLR